MTTDSKVTKAGSKNDPKKGANFTISDRKVFIHGIIYREGVS